MKNYLNSDLAIEKSGIFNTESISRNEYSEIEKNGYMVCRLSITNDELANKYGRAVGNYVTVFSDRIWTMDERSVNMLAQTVADELETVIERICGSKKRSERSVLVAGLGNSDITADSIGPLTVKQISVTRHVHSIYSRLLGSNDVCKVSAIIPGVLAQTGIETVELIRGAAENVSPDVVIVIDALAARSCERLGATVQISDNGISPGSGIGNLRKAINRENIGFDVIALGVPTVVDSATLVYDALQQAGIEEISADLENVLKKGRDFFVSPKESDVISKIVSSLLAQTLDIVFGIYT